MCPPCGSGSAPSGSKRKTPATSCGWRTGTRWTSVGSNASRQRRRPTSRVARSEQLGKALALFRGEPLADFRYDAFASQEAARLDELRLAVIEERIQTELELGRHEEVVLELERLIAEHPLREGLRAQLMLALYRAGRQADALQAFQDARERAPRRARARPQPRAAAARAADPEPGPRARSPDAFAPARHPAAATKPSGIVTFLLTEAERSARELVRTVVGQHGGFDVRHGRRFRARRLRPRAGRGGRRGRYSAGDEERRAPPDRHQLGRSGRHGHGVHGVGRPRRGEHLERRARRADPPLADDARPPPRNAVGHDRSARPGRAPSDGPHGGSARCSSSSRPDLEREFPPPRSLETRPTNLPLQPTPLVGRDREIREVAELLRRPDARVVTLTGTGGTGKTRLAAAGCGRAPRRLPRRSLLRQPGAARESRPRPADRRSDPRRPRQRW